MSVMADATTNRECMCGNACSYFVIRCDRCSEWYYISCHKLTEDAIKRLKDFFCNPCKSKDSKLHNTLKEHPTDKGATYERRACAGVTHHAFHRIRGKRDPVKCICKPRCKPFCIVCEGCKRLCHVECVSYTKEMADAVANYYCPPCMERNTQLSIEYAEPRLSREGSMKRAATSPEGSARQGAPVLIPFGAYTPTTEPTAPAHQKRKKAAVNCPPRPAANDDVDTEQEGQHSENAGPFYGDTESPASTKAEDTARGSNTPNVAITAARTTDANGPVADTDLAEPSGTGTPKQNKKQKCVCGSPCAYYVVQCDHCRAWSFASCHGRTKNAIEHLKSFYCTSCERSDPKLTNTQKQRPTDGGVTYERRLCERESRHHEIHRYQGKEERLRCNHAAPCKNRIIECNKCRRRCHFECVSLAKEMDGRIAKYYCPPCAEENPHLLIAYRTSQLSAMSSKKCHSAISKHAVESSDTNGPVAETSDNGPAKKGRITERLFSGPTSEGVTVRVKHVPDALDHANEVSVDRDAEALQVKEEKEPDTRPGALDFMLLQARVRAIESQLRGKDAELEETKADNKRLAEERQRLGAELTKSKADYERLSEDHKKSEDALKSVIAEKDTELADLRRQQASTSQLHQAIVMLLRSESSGENSNFASHSSDT